MRHLSDWVKDCQEKTPPPPEEEDDTCHLYKGLVRDWTLYKVSDETLHTMMIDNDAVVDVMISHGNTCSGGVHYVAGWAEDVETLQIPVSDFLDGTEGHYYLAQAPIVTYVSGSMVPGCMYHLAQGMTLPERIPTTSTCHPVSVNLWCSVGQPSLSSLHYDCHDNLLCTVRGTKIVRWCPFDTIGSQCLEDCPFEHGYGNHCTKDITLFPEYEMDKSYPISNGFEKKRDCHECVMSPGDAVYIPEGTWHQVYSDGNSSLAVNFWWDDTSTNVSDSYARCMEYNTNISEYVIKYLGEYAQSHIQHLGDHVNGDIVYDILCNVKELDRRKLLLESTIAYTYSRGSSALFKYMSDIAYRLLPRLTLQDKLRFWESTTPLYIEYMTTGVSHICTAEYDTSSIYQHIYSSMDNVQGFSFHSMLADKKTDFKKHLHVYYINASSVP